MNPILLASLLGAALVVAVSMGKSNTFGKSIAEWQGLGYVLRGGPVTVNGHSYRVWLSPADRTPGLLVTITDTDGLQGIVGAVQEVGRGSGMTLTFTEVNPTAPAQLIEEARGVVQKLTGVPTTYDPERAERDVPLI